MDEGGSEDELEAGSSGPPAAGSKRGQRVFLSKDEGNASHGTSGQRVPWKEHGSHAGNGGTAEAGMEIGQTAADRSSGDRSLREIGCLLETKGSSCRKSRPKALESVKESSAAVSKRRCVWLRMPIVKSLEEARRVPARV